VQRNI
ncbi:hypothetical protein EC80566_0703, partial [Escherichia coli 8.0566]